MNGKTEQVDRGDSEQKAFNKDNFLGALENIDTNPEYSLDEAKMLISYEMQEFNKQSEDTRRELILTEEEDEGLYLLSMLAKNDCGEEYASCVKLFQGEARDALYDTSNIDERNPLHIALKHNSTSVVKAILENDEGNNLDLILPDGNDLSPLANGLKYGAYEASKEFLEQLQEKDRIEDARLRESKEKRTEDRKTKSVIANCDSAGNSALHMIAIETQDEDQQKMLDLVLQNAQGELIYRSKNAGKETARQLFESNNDMELSQQIKDKHVETLFNYIGKEAALGNDFNDLLRLKRKFERYLDGDNDKLDQMLGQDTPPDSSQKPSPGQVLRKNLQEKRQTYQQNAGRDISEEFDALVGFFQVGAQRSQGVTRGGSNAASAGGSTATSLSGKRSHEQMANAFDTLDLMAAFDESPDNVDMFSNLARAMASTPSAASAGYAQMHQSQSAGEETKDSGEPRRPAAFDSLNGNQNVARRR